MSETTGIEDAKGYTDDNKVSHIPNVSGSCPEWLSKAISELNLYSHDAYGKFRSPNQEVKDLLWEKIQKASLFEPTEVEIDKASIDCFNESYLNVKMTEAQIENILDAFKYGAEYAIQKMKTVRTDKQIKDACWKLALEEDTDEDYPSDLGYSAKYFESIFVKVLAKLKESV